MFGEEKKLTDTDLSPTPLLNKESGEGVRWMSYPKLNKLVTAMYIVTDIMDKDEPIRLKLRTLAVEILSDIPTEQSGINSISRTNLSEKVKTILSFLDVASTVNLISEMNFNILKKEFFELAKSIDEPKQINPIWLEEFLGANDPTPSLPEGKGVNTAVSSSSFGGGEGGGEHKGHLDYARSKHTYIGVQKGNTLMKALSDKTNLLSDSDINLSHKNRNDFGKLKKQRREDIIKAIKNNAGSATITDIKTRISSLPIGQTGSLSTCSEKTLQRELVSMVKDGVLYKTGEKRWSKYFIK